MIDELSIEEHERFHEILSKLNDFVSSPERPYWLMLPIGEYAECASICKPCIDELLPQGVWGDDYDGGYSCGEDNTLHCEKCGKLLQYSLTDYGAMEELAHFTENKPSAEELANPDICYELERIGYAICDREKIIRFIELFDGHFLSQEE